MTAPWATALTMSGFRFRAPVSLDNNAFIARLDYHLTADGKHTLFWRGALQNLINPQAPFLPGRRRSRPLTDHSKGFVVGYTAVLSPTWSIRSTGDSLARARVSWGTRTRRGTCSTVLIKASLTATTRRRPSQPAR